MARLEYGKKWVVFDKVSPRRVQGSGGASDEELAANTDIPGTASSRGDRGLGRALSGHVTTDPAGSLADHRLAHRQQRTVRRRHRRHNDLPGTLRCAGG